MWNPIWGFLDNTQAFSFVQVYYRSPCLAVNLCHIFGTIGTIGTAPLKLAR